MNEIISLLFPSIFGTIVYAKNKEQAPFFTYFCFYIINILITTIFCYLIIYLIYNTETLYFNNIFTIKYILLSSVISVLVGTIMTIIDKFLKLKIEVKNDEKKKTKNNKINK